jgi:hypothetical protein
MLDYFYIFKFIFGYFKLFHPRLFLVIVGFFDNLKLLYIFCYYKLFYLMLFLVIIGYLCYYMLF